MNRQFGAGPLGEAKVKYSDSEFFLLQPGAYVRCAVTGVEIPLDELRYWSVDLQEPYATPDASFKRHQEIGENS